MTKTRFLTIAVILLLILNAFLIGSMLIHRKHARGFQTPKEIVVKKLDFTSSQILEYEKIIAPHKSEVKNLLNQISSKKKDLYQTLKNQDPEQDEKHILSELNLLQNQLEDTHLNHFKDIRKICTGDSQIEKYNKLADELQEMFDLKRRGRKPNP